jgi:hypothetical protein
MPRKKIHCESSAFFWFLDLEQMASALDEAVVIAALDPERLVRGTRPGSSVNRPKGAQFAPVGTSPTSP